jgi:hypothetical protein
VAALSAFLSDFFEVVEVLSEAVDVDDSVFASPFESPAVPSAFAGVAFDGFARLSVL